MLGKTLAASSSGIMRSIGDSLVPWPECGIKIKRSFLSGLYYVAMTHGIVEGGDFLYERFLSLAMMLVECTCVFILALPIYGSELCVWRADH